MSAASPHNRRRLPYGQLVEEGCRPRRAGYAADLRDEALVAAGFPLSSINRQEVNVYGDPLEHGVGCRIQGACA